MVLWYCCVLIKPVANYLKFDVFWSSELFESFVFLFWVFWESIWFLTVILMLSWAGDFVRVLNFIDGLWLSFGDEKIIVFLIKFIVSLEFALDQVYFFCLSMIETLFSCISTNGSTVSRIKHLKMLQVLQST